MAELKVVANYPSAMVDFPNNYKITGFQFNISSIKKLTRRKTLNVVEVFGMIGGLRNFLNLFASKFMSYFTGSALASILANALYTWTSPIDA